MRFAYKHKAKQNKIHKPHAYTHVCQRENWKIRDEYKIKLSSEKHFAQSASQHQCLPRS